MNREVHVRICGRLGARFPGPTRQQETEPSPTGLRRRRESFVSGHRETKTTAPVLDSTPRSHSWIESKLQGKRAATWAALGAISLVLRRCRPFPALGASRLQIWLNHVLYAIIRFRARRRQRRKFLTIHQHPDLVRIQNLALDQSPRHFLQRVAIIRKNLPRRAVAVA